METDHLSMLKLQFIFVKRGPGVNQRCYIDGLVQEKRNSIADAMELRLSCTNPSIYSIVYFTHCVLCQNERYLHGLRFL